MRLGTRELFCLIRSTDSCCWDPPLDYWNNDHIQSALASFGRMLMWENDQDHLARLMVIACVSDLQDVPYFLVLTKAEGFQRESWTMQVQIVE
jgi:hypothetical protein